MAPLIFITVSLLMGEQRGGLELPTQPMHNNFVSPVADAHCSQKVGDFQLSGMVEFIYIYKKKLC